MESPLRKKIGSIMKDHKKRQVWYRIVTSLAVVVVFVTTYMLILPAITMENKAECGITEHQHDANCYSTHYEKEKVLDCTTETLGVHKHTDACYDAQHKLVCGYADFVIHQHDASCYDTDGTLICEIPEHKLHQHTENCYQMQKQLICMQEESAGHTHTAECYTKEQGDLICVQEEHTHGESCYDEGGNLVCEKEEHVHGDECYQWNDVLTCTQEESAGHQHSDACYQDVKVLVCEEPAELHTHTSACYQDGILVCGKAEVKEHQHSDACFKEKDVLVETLVCDRVEHVHTDECFKKNNEDNETIENSETSEVSSDEEVSSEVAEEASSEEISSEFESEEVSSEATSSEESSSEEAYSEEESTSVEEGSSETVSTEETTEEITTEEMSSEEESTEEVSSEVETEEESSEEESSEAESDDIADRMSNEQSWCIVRRVEDESSTENLNSLNSIALFADDNTEDLAGYELSVRIVKIVNGQEVELDPSGLKEGDNVKVDIGYTIANGLPDGKNTLIYQLPGNFKLNKEQSGSVMQNGVAVGTYTISMDGKITIVIDKDKFNPNVSFTGDVGFEGSAQMTGKEDSEEIKFPGISETVTINRDKTKYDLTVGKQAKLSEDRKTIDYTVTVSSEFGTNGDAVSISDKFSGDATGKYQDSSFKLVKVDKDGNETVMDVKPSFTTEDGNQKFNYDKLPALGKGESYKLTYKADVTPNAQGGGTVTNTAKASTPSKQGEDTKKTTIPGTIISKSGSVEWWPKKLIKWEIVVNKDGIVDVGDYTVGDNIPGTLYEAKGITISPALPDGTTSIKEFPFKFPADAGNKTYTITYYTLPPTTSGTITNTATIEKDGDKSEAVGEVPYYAREEGVSKSFDGEKEEQGNNILNWTTTVTVSEEEQNEITYSDIILDTVDQSGQIVTDTKGKNPHYAIASTLQETLKSDNNIQLELENGTKLNYEQAVAQGYQFEFKFYEAKDSQEINGDDAVAHVGYFTVKVTKNDGTKFQAKTLTLKYFTYADYSNMAEGAKWTLKNQAGYHDKISEGKTDHGDSSSLKKESGVKRNGNVEYNTPDSVKYDELDGYLYYRLILTTSSNHNSDLKITDTLSDSGMTFDTDSLDVRFVQSDNLYNQKDEWTTWLNGSSYTYNLNGEQKPDVFVEGQTMTITIKGGYNKGTIGESEVFDGNEKNHTFVITYRVKISDDPYWKDLSQTAKVYGNTVTWDKLTDSTKTTVNERNVENVEKTGKQRVATDKDGKVICDGDGKPIYLETVDYQIVINPKGEDLLKDSDTITLTDKLDIRDEYGNSSENAKNIKAYLEMDSVKLYEYNVDTEDHLGSLIDRSVYKLHYDDSNPNAPVITVELPDETPCVLVYAYTFDKGSLATAYKVKNEAQLSGKNQSSQELRIEKNSSYANVDQSELSIYKVDEDDQSVRLGNAKFKLEEYLNGQWSVVSYANLAENGGTKEGEGDSTLYVTGQDGYLRFEKYNTNEKNEEDNASKGLLRKNTIYRLTEVAAPTGYELNSTPYYFVLMGDGKQSSDFEAEMNSAINGNGKAYYFKAGKKVAFNITDKFVGVSVRKVWLDENGDTQTSGMPDSIQVQLYQQKSVGDGTKTPIGNAVTLSAENNWEYTWFDGYDSLPTVDENGIPYYYSVEEVGIPSGYTVSYTNNNGIIVGGNEMVITNRAEKESITLPETGGTGTYLYTLGGVLLMAGASLLMYIHSMRKGGKRIW